MTCPECHGRGRQPVQTLVRHGREMVPTMRSAECSTCHGVGVVTDERVKAMREGQERRSDRRRRMLTLTEEAKRLGVTPHELLAIERGVSLEGAKP